MGNLTKGTVMEVENLFNNIFFPYFTYSFIIPILIGHKVPKPKSDQMKRITKRDIVAFITGVLFMGIMDVAFNWEETKTVFSKGFNDGFEDANKQFQK